MWSAGSKRRGIADVFLSEGQIAMVTSSGATWMRDSGTVDEGLAALVGKLRESDSVRRLNIWLGAALCRPVRVAPIAGARTRAERVQLTELAAVNQSGLAAPCRVVIDDASGAEETIAVVVEERVLASIEEALASVHVRAVRIQPWWTQALKAALQSNPALRALAVWEGRALTVMTGAGRLFASAQTLFPVDSPESAAAAFARTLITGMISPDESLAVALDWSTEPEADVVAADETSAVFTPWVRPLEART